jgi:hypothetical protein
MVAKVISGKDMQGALNYNEHKVKTGAADCILANRFHGTVQEMNFQAKLDRLLFFSEKNKMVKTNTLHISLNFDVNEKISGDRLCEIATSYMGKIGFGDQPYLVYEHKDAAHPHVHIITTNIRDDGKRIDIHNIGRNQSEKARREIEKEFGLVHAESKKKAQNQFIHPANVQKAAYGKSETRRSISNIVGMVTRTYKYTSLPELNAVLKQFNVTADKGREGSLMHEKKGLIYSLIDEKGNKAGIPVKASSIYGKPTLAFLEKQFKLNELLRKPYKNQLRDSVEECLNSKPKGLHDLVKLLNKKGIHLAIRENAEGRIYGATFVDNRMKCIFKGSDLGKQYGANALLERLNAIDHVKKGPEIFRPGYTEVFRLDTAEKNNSLSFGSETDQVLKNLTEAGSKDYLSPEAAMKLKKKKRRKGRSL